MNKPYFKPGTYYTCGKYTGFSQLVKYRPASNSIADFVKNQLNNK